VVTRGLKLIGMCAALLLGLGPVRPARATEPPARWLGDDLPLPLTVKTPQDIAFKAAAERQFLVFNLMAAGKLAFQRGDYSTAADKWETLLRIPGLDPQIQAAVGPFLADALAKLPNGERPEPKPEAKQEPIVPEPPTAGKTAGGPRPPSPPRRVYVPTASVSGTVSGGGQVGPGGAVVWLKRIDGSTPRIVPPANQIITQREKTFLPHVLAVPLGTTVQFRNDDRIYHNVFSIAKPNEFDAGIRASGSTYSRTFASPGAVQLLCNIHSKAQASGAFLIKGVPPGRYEVSAWHEAASSITRSKIVVGPEGVRDLAVTVGGDKRPSAFVPDKYGHKRQPQLGY
jgi:plastocyanin